MDEVAFDVADGVGQIHLRRPKAINALTLEMLHAIEKQLLSWVDDDTVSRISITGEGERGYCAGADVRQLRELVLEDPALAFGYLRDEYRLDALVANYPKPVVVNLHGVSMGGGLGFATHGSQRIGTLDTRWAMPEVGIGLWPDVGMTHQLAQCPGEIGAYLAMTGEIIDGASALYAGLIDEIEEADPESSDLAAKRVWIDECFAGDDAAAIMTALESHPAEEARAAAAVLRTRCPLSVCVALESVRRASKCADVAEVLDQDLVLASHFVRNPDFLEGVRAQLVDRDRNPRWQHASIEDVTREEVEALFIRSDARDSDGWKAITRACEAVYPEQTEPLHYATAVTFEQGGSDPLDGVSVYRVSEPVPHWHYVGYGLSDIYDARVTSVDEEGVELSGFGYELTFRAADPAAADPAGTPPPWPPALLQALARHVVSSGEAFVPGSVVISPGPLVQGTQTNLTCLMFIADPDLSAVETRSGEIRFVQAIGLTTDEAQAIGVVGVDRFAEIFTHLHHKGVTLLERASVLDDPTISETLGIPVSKS